MPGVFYATCRYGENPLRKSYFVMAVLIDEGTIVR